MKAASKELAKFVTETGISSLHDYQIIENLLAAATFDGSIQARQGALIALTQLAQDIGKPAEPFLIPLLPFIFDRMADKVAIIRTTAQATGKAVISLISATCVQIVLPMIFEAMGSEKKWQTQQGACSLLSSLVPKCSEQISLLLPKIVPILSECIWNIRSEVNEAANATMLKLITVIGNPDVESVLPDVISCIGDPTHVPEAVEKVSETTFVKAVRAPLLSIMMPLLGRGLAERANIVKRRCAVIVDNMCRLVPDSWEIIAFLPDVVPGLDRVIEIGGDPDMVSVCARALITLFRVSGQDIPDDLVEAANYDASKPKISSLTHSTTKRDLDKMEKVNARMDAIKLRQETREKELDMLVADMPGDSEVKGPSISMEKLGHIFKDEILSVSNGLDMTTPFVQQCLNYAVSVADIMIKNDLFDIDLWEDESIFPYLQNFIGDEAASKKVCRGVYEKCCLIMGKNDKDEDEEEGAEYLTNCEFSLGYGAMVLLRKARLKLKRGARYGICGANGCGKSTLLKAIANGQVDGFPPQDEVRTFMVADELQSVDADTRIIDYMCSDPKLKNNSKEKIIEILHSVGFTEEVQTRGVGSLSGGWKMKLALARGILYQADILLLDEPTNHLDVTNVAWLEEYLCSLDRVTSLIISHDTKFLDNVCTGIVHYESKRLKIYKGNLSDFVAIKPEAKAYYTLEDAAYKFVFPNPGLLDGVSRKDKPVLRLKNVSFTYPNTDRLALDKVTASCCLSSRIAIIGANGAGKSTLIKVLTGEMTPQVGDVWKHPTLRVAYVAQHPLKYLNMHLEKTPNQYVQWRFENGEDKELIMKQSRQLSKEEEDQMAKEIEGKNGQKRRIEAIVGRAKLKKSFQYEVKWTGMIEKHNTWFPRERLEEWGFSKLLQAFDDKTAGREGLSGFNVKELTQNSIQAHFEDFGLDPQFSTHGKIQSLSGGQKIKTILASATWANPHMLILDEPTNYLDRESLAALAQAIREFEGGVVIISHNHDFTDALCSEKWYMDAGVLTIGGKQAAAEDDDAVDEAAESLPTDVTHDFDGKKGPLGGGVKMVKVSSGDGKKKLTKKQIKEREYQEKRAELVRLGIMPE